MEQLVAAYGLWALGIALFIDDLGIPLPASTVIFGTAVYAHTHPEFPIVGLYLMALFIPPISNGILFWWGRNGARHWLSQHGHRIFLTPPRMVKAETFFTKYGDRTVFLAAHFNSIRAVCSVVAGSLGMHPAKFFAYHCAGIVIWATIVVGGGYWLGEALWSTMQEYLKIAILLALTFFIAYKLTLYWLLTRKNKK